jgi:hypothetical protein
MVRGECLNEPWFVSLAHARSIIEDWRIEDNTERPHSSLAKRTPQEFAAARIKKDEERVFLTADSDARSKSGVRSLEPNPARISCNGLPVPRRYVDLICRRHNPG